MRRRILVVALTAVTLVITVFGIPLSVLIKRNVIAQERLEIEKLALRSAVQITPNALTGGQFVLPPSTEREPVGLYDNTGRLVEGIGPRHLEPPASVALQGNIGQYSNNTELVVAVPLLAHDQVFGVVRASSPQSEVTSQAHRDWFILALIGLGAAGIATAIATIQSRRLARPLETLERVATELGHGNLGARAPASGVAEIDRAGTALNATAARLAALIAREQAFSAHASHQLRTPLTGLRLRLEAALRGDRETLEQAARSAIRSADELEQTIEDILSLTRRSIPRGPSLAVEDLLDEVQRRWAGLLSERGRSIHVNLDSPPTTTTPAAAIRQVLDVLVDNAYRHGWGTVNLRARSSAGALAIDVVDEGHAATLLPPPAESLGLALASSIAAGLGGRLMQGPADQATRLTLLLPSEDDSETIADSSPTGRSNPRAEP